MSQLLKTMTLNPPDVSQAVLLSKLNAEVDPVKRNTDLLVRRTQTAALRELWKTLKSQGRIIQSRFDEPSKLRDGFQQRQFHRKRNNFSESRQGKDTFDGKAQRSCKSAPASIAHQNIELTLFPGGKERPNTGRESRYTRSSDFRQSFFVPNPPPVCITKGTHQVKESSLWENEVRKRVPDRPKFSVPVYISCAELKLPTCDGIQTTPSSFFRHIDTKTSKPSKEYDVDPEWSLCTSFHSLSLIV
ncbi:uncharacterized protein LOC106070515 [Biomphalaria glabrata]|uniref:Uncharacterized protein LOC106070515 n=1 Tax=Biomphalaria glabrata TaxID=6526 RepID=A0A9U8EFR6_BIOGL|nr:uncharacterized protein LOC106070515 [Biomphalaria glabrata]